MKTFLLSFLFLVVGIAYADNTITSKEYVDGQVSNLQTQIPAKNTNTVLTNTGVSGEIGSKKIYDANVDYGSQTDALVTAETFNTAVQNAINDEFVCIEWAGEHISSNCLLWQINNTQPSQSPNLLCTPLNPRHGMFDATTGIFTNTDTAPKDYIHLYIISYGASYQSQDEITTHTIKHLYQPQTIIETFTTSPNTHLLRIKHNDSTFDVSIFFRVDPSTTYTLLINAIETNPSIVGGMKLQLMLVQGEYNSDEFIPCGNVYMPQN